MKIAYLIEIPEIYDGFSITVYEDGTMENRWGDGTGNPLAGYEYRWKATEDYIASLD